MSDQSRIGKILFSLRLSEKYKFGAELSSQDATELLGHVRNIEELAGLEIEELKKENERLKNELDGFKKEREQEQRILSGIPVVVSSFIPENTVMISSDIARRAGWVAETVKAENDG